MALRLAALRLVDAHGLDHVTVEMMAEAADVSTRTFFNYFPTKEDALVGPGPEAVAEVEEFCARRPDEESALSVLRALVLERSAAFAHKSEEMDLRMRVLAANPILYARFHAGFHEIERVLRVQLAGRCGLDAERDLYPRLLAATGGAVIRSAMDLWREGSSRTLDSLVDEAFDLCAAGLDVVSAAPGTAVRRRPPATAERALTGLSPN
jgi:AcrR family transcriptional regulator